MRALNNLSWKCWLDDCSLYFINKLTFFFICSCISLMWWWLMWVCPWKAAYSCVCCGIKIFFLFFQKPTFVLVELRLHHGCKGLSKLTPIYDAQPIISTPSAGLGSAITAISYVCSSHFLEVPWKDLPFSRKNRFVLL